MGFFDSAFWNCPSYTYQMFVYGIFISIFMVLIALIGSNVLTLSAGVVCLVFYVFVAFRSLYHMVDPNPGCAYTGFPNDRGINPWAS